MPGSTHISKIRIQRFRSIEDQEIVFKPITIFVGDNDSGKSNILKAINLLVNEKVTVTAEYNHARDYYKFDRRKRKAEETIITATIEYSPNPDIELKQWRKTWRLGARPYVDGTPELLKSAPRRTNVTKWINRFKYRYIPANKEDSYIQLLMRELYDLFTSTIQKKIQGSADDLIKHIENETSSVSQEILNILRINSKIQLPKNLRDVFSLLTFETDHGISIEQRGDGIRIRHIPVILNFLADRKNHQRGIVRVSSIWGYEEPENNLEMGAAFELADQFVKYARENEIQIIMTTHSPAFYQLMSKAPDICQVYFVRKEALSDGIGSKTIAEPIGSRKIQEPDFMGLMPLVAPYIQELEKLQKELKKSMPLDKPIILVEGGFDKKIIEHIINIKYPSKKDMLNVYACGGASKVPLCMGYAKAKITFRLKPGQMKSIGVLDHDLAGKTAKEHCEKSHFISPSKNEMVFINRPEIYCNDMKDYWNYSLEHLLPKYVWDYAKEQGWLERVSENSKIYFENEDITSIEEIREFLLYRDNKLNDAEYRIKTQYKVKDNDKENLADHIVEKIKNTNDIPLDLHNLVDLLLNKMGLND